MPDRANLELEAVTGILDELHEPDRASHRLMNQAIVILEPNGPAGCRPARCPDCRQVFVSAEQDR